jgi:heme-degrading monooxygenase HmoA
MLANTPQPPYYAVIFSSIKKNNDKTYNEMAQKMEKLAKQQQGFLGIESAREEVGITVSYWQSLEAIQQWKNNVAHIEAQAKGKLDWYKNYKVRIAKVERAYSF